MSSHPLRMQGNGSASFFHHCLFSGGRQQLLRCSRTGACPQPLGSSSFPGNWGNAHAFSARQCPPFLSPRAYQKHACQSMHGHVYKNKNHFSPPSPEKRETGQDAFCCWDEDELRTLFLPVAALPVSTQNEEVQAAKAAFFFFFCHAARRRFSHHINS